MKLHLPGVSTVIFLIALGSNTNACVAPPTVSPERTAELMLETQRGLWRDASSVFVARSQNVQSNLPRIGNRAELVPLLQLKGPKVDYTVHITHTEMTSCGPSPFLNALNDNSGDIFIVFASSEQPSATSLMNTMEPSFVRDPVIIQAWQNAYDAAERNSR